MAGANSKEDRSIEPRNFVRALSRGLAVLHAMSNEGRPISLSDVARAVDLDRATARRLLLTLESLSFVKSDSGRFTLAPRALDLGNAYLVSTGVWEVGRAILPELVRSLQESASIAVLDGHEVVYIVRERVGRRLLGVSRSIGSRLPAYCTSLGRVLLASLPLQERTRLLEQSNITRLTRLTVTDIVELELILEKVAAQQFSIVDQELETGLISMAVPILDGSQRVVAALNISAQSSNVKAPQLQDRFLVPLQDAAHKISQEIALLS